MNWKTTIVEEQPAAVRQAIVELEARGLKFCTHFGVANAVVLLQEMDGAFHRGDLYKWLQERCGISTNH